MKELPRRLFHIFGGLLLPATGLLLPQDVFLPALISVTVAFLLFEVIRLRSVSVNRWFTHHFQPLLREKEASRPTGSAYLLIAAVITFLLFDKPIAVMALSFVVVGDPIAGMIGETWGKRRIRGKSLEGSAACFLACLVIGAILASITGTPLALVIIGAACATLVEFSSLPINDNLTIPLISGGAMTGVNLLYLC